jgi:hypothetical protein
MSESPPCGTHTVPEIIRLDCPIDCLQAVLSAGTFNPLARAYDAPFDPPSTVGDVVEPYQQGNLRRIPGLGPRRVGEIEVALIFAGVTRSRCDT